MSWPMLTPFWQSYIGNNKKVPANTTEVKINDGRVFPDILHHVHTCKHPLCITFLSQILYNYNLYVFVFKGPDLNRFKSY